MHLIFYINHQKRTSWGTASPMPLGPSSLAALGQEANVMREFQHGQLWPSSRPKVGKVDWRVLDQLPAIHGIQFFCDPLKVTYPA